MKLRPSMKQVMRELRAIARKHGFEVRIYTYRALQDESYIRNFSPQHPSGEFEQAKKRIVIRRYKNTFLKSIMWVLAHEIGHLQHYVSGKFPRYYSNYWSHQVLKYHLTYEVPKKLNISGYLQGIRAERDCDKWATEFLTSRGYECRPRRLYPHSNVMGFDLYSGFMRSKR